jgi:hypothetical protein
MMLSIATEDIARLLEQFSAHTEGICLIFKDVSYQKRAFVNTVINIWVPLKARNFLTR